MKIERDGGQVVITPENESLDYIACAVIMASYESAHAFGSGFMRAYKTVLTKEMALRMIRGEDVSKDYFTNPNKPDKVHMDYVFGRCCKTDVEIDRVKKVVLAGISTVDQNPGSVMNRAKEILSRFVSSGKVT